MEILIPGIIAIAAFLLVAAGGKAMYHLVMALCSLAMIGLLFFCLRMIGM